MTYDGYELSVDSSRPDDLFDFIYDGTGEHYRVTSSAFSITFGGHIYKPLPGLSRSSVQSSTEDGKNQMKLTGIARNTPYFLRHLFSTRTHATSLQIYTLQPDDSFLLIWTGRVINVARPKNAGISIIASPINVLAKKPVSCVLYQIQCANKLFDYRCGVSKTTYTRTGTLSSISGNTIVSSTFALEDDNWFTGGEISVNGEVKTIVYHVGDTIRILDTFYADDASAGDSFVAIAGCPHNLESCATRFDNALNYRGTPFIPDADDIQTGKPFTY